VSIETRRNRLIWAASLLVAALASRASLAQRADENAVAAASDAFGNTIGTESIGLYSTTNVRGFSPITAGNLRLDGLYFDQLDFLNPRLFEDTVIRVGPSAQGYPPLWSTRTACARDI
jgi:iron complex outermembrane recepter protein